ncbi:MAG TPA: ThiF family adenylyltransferase, partial [Longimicrobiaceae bacterium]|nr:ThiF family adenylyltransferase [Longimicrobiaceae bacterium]
MIFGNPLIPGELERAEEHAPLAFDCTVPGDAEWMGHLAATGQAHTVHDDLERQLDELVRLRAGGRVLSPGELAAERERLLDGALPAEHGRWIFYPWSGRLVHVLGPDEFRELRLHRNRHRITGLEQERLAGVTVGVAGLAVGAAAAVTLALEGGFGHLKLADGGEVALGDLNHLAAGVHELGLPRAVAAARRVYEVDPYAAVSLHGALEGDGALEEFLGGAAPLDVVVDASDDLHLKLRLRQRARAAGVPVLMETSDRGTLDVERFDLEPERPFFHGRLGAVGPAEWAALDDERRAALVVALAGPEELSQRAGASLVELR